MTDFKYKHLFEPIKLGSTLFRNRLFASPTGYQDIKNDGILTEGAAAYYERKAMGGAASVATCEGIVDGEFGKGGDYHVCLDNPGTLHSLARVAYAIKRHGAVASQELQHTGMYTNRSLAVWGGKSQGIAYGPVEFELDGRTVLPMTDEIIERTINKFADAAAFAKRCGFGMVTVHAGHGWLLHQFLSPDLNTRKDKWGGASIENRARLTVAVCDAIRKKVGPGFPVEIRISGSEVYEGGYGIDEGIAFAKLLDGHVNLIHVSAGSHEVEEVFAVTHPSMFLPDGVNLKYAAEIKKHVKTPVATVGALGESGPHGRDCRLRPGRRRRDGARAYLRSRPPAQNPHGPHRRDQKVHALPGLLLKRAGQRPGLLRDQPGSRARPGDEIRYPESRGL
jgi:2,4-dienoyl-CoA reductase-like NADH-dependent reductase (Old Yellow Enzyme family)